MQKANELVYMTQCAQFTFQQKDSGTQDINPLTSELDPSAQRWLTGFFTGDFVS
jgi:hypothetical protein